MVALVGVLVVELKHTYQDERGLLPNYDLPLKVLARDPTDRLSSFASYYANPLKGQAHYSTSGEGKLQVCTVDMNNPLKRVPTHSQPT